MKILRILPFLILTAMLSGCIFPHGPGRGGDRYGGGGRDDHGQSHCNDDHGRGSDCHDDDHGDHGNYGDHGH